jgi:hypothetical protein
MPSDLDSDKLERAMVGALRDVTEKLGAIREQVREEVAQQLVRYREDVHRTIMGIHTRLLLHEKAIEDDHKERAARQQDLDGQLRAIRRNQTWRMRIELALIVIGVVVYLWVR